VVVGGAAPSVMFVLHWRCTMDAERSTSVRSARVASRRMPLCVERHLVFAVNPGSDFRRAVECWRAHAYVTIFRLVIFH